MVLASGTGCSRDAVIFIEIDCFRAVLGQKTVYKCILLYLRKNTAKRRSMAKELLATSRDGNDVDGGEESQDGAEGNDGGKPHNARDG